MPCYGCNNDQNDILGPASVLLRLLRRQEPRKHSRPCVCLATVAAPIRANTASSSPRIPCYGCYGNKSQDGILVPASALRRFLQQEKARMHSRPCVCLAPFSTATRAGRHSRPRVCLPTVATATTAKTAFSSQRLPCYGCYESQDGIPVPVFAMLRGQKPRKPCYGCFGKQGPVT